MEASGKFILLGEHFAIAGVPALAFPVPKLFSRVTAIAQTLGQTAGPTVCNEDIIEQAKARVCAKLGVSGLFNILSDGNIPFSRGFGSSAAFAVALVGAVAEFYNLSLDRAVVHGAAMEVEKIFHKTPSGVDVAVILERSPIWFKRDLPVRRISNEAVDFVVVDSGQRSLCSTLVGEVLRFAEKHPRIWEEFSDQMHELVEQTEQALKVGNAAVVADSMSNAQGILERLSLGHPQVNRVIEAGLAAGALAGKVSGAGRGGAVVLATEPGLGSQFALRMSDRGFAVLAEVSSTTNRRSQFSQVKTHA